MTDSQAQSPNISSSASPSLAEGKALLRRSRLLGRVSAIIFFIAALAVIDALQTLVRHEFNSIDLLPGESVLVSGMMPAKAKTHEDLVIETDGNPCLRFTPLETYKGFWMGGHMWRAELTVADACPQGKAVITIVDIVDPTPPAQDTTARVDERDRSILYGGQQNPALIFSINLWPDETARRKADNSLFHRFTALPPFAVAGICVALAVLAGFGNWLLFSRAERTLAGHGVFFVHGVKELREEPPKPNKKGKTPVLHKGPGPVGWRAAFARVNQAFVFGDEVTLFDRDFKEQARGTIVEVDKIKAHALFPLDGVRPGYGWLVSRASEADTVREK